MARYVPNRRAIAELIDSPMVRHAVHDVAEDLKDRAQVEIQSSVDNATSSGELSRSGRVVETKAGSEVVFDAPHAGAVHNGSKPHRIYARNAKALHWVSESGEDVFAKWVDHPGTAPNPYLQRAVDSMATKE